MSILGQSPESAKSHAAFIWSVADLLRGDFRPTEYSKVILPLTVIRRLDCVLEPTKADVLAVHAKYGDEYGDGDAMQAMMRKATGGLSFYNTSPLTLPELLEDSPSLADSLRSYNARFSPLARDVIEKFDFDLQIGKLHSAGLLYHVLARFCDVDLHPNVVSNVEMGYLYEELVRRFSELTNESAGEHFTPREVIQFMVDLLIADDPALHKGGSLRTLLDPACGTGGMLSVAQQRVRKINPDATLETYGQELNAETFAVCRSDIMVKGQNPKNIAFGNSFSQDAFKEQTFDFLLANPPFGVEWKKVADVVKDEHRDKGFRGRFGAGLPRVSDGSLLFLQHMLSKMKRPADGGSRVAIVFNASPLFTGTAGTGESEIRRWIIENDWLETVVALPDQLFYNTGIATYVWVLTNRKTPERRGSVQLIDARGHFERVRRSLGEKRKEISSAQTDAILKLRDQLESGDDVKILPNESFGFLRITIERPKRLRWEVTADTLARLAGHPKLALLDAETMGVVTSALQRWAGSTVERQTAVQKVNEALLAGGQKGRALRDAALDALSVPDPDAPPMVNDNGDVEPDPALRDYGIVALPGAVERFEADPTARLNGAEYRAAVERYLETDVLPHTSDAWVDHGKTRIGYEIHVTRHFYKHIPARPLETIRGEIQKVEEDIKMLLREVAE